MEQRGNKRVRQEQYEFPIPELILGDIMCVVSRWCTLHELLTLCTLSREARRVWEMKQASTLALVPCHKIVSTIVMRTLRGDEIHRMSRALHLMSIIDLTIVSDYTAILSHLAPEKSLEQAHADLLNEYSSFINAVRFKRGVKISSMCVLHVFTSPTFPQVVATAAALSIARQVIVAVNDSDIQSLTNISKLYELLCVEDNTSSFGTEAKMIYFQPRLLKLLFSNAWGNRVLSLAQTEYNIYLYNRQLGIHCTTIDSGHLLMCCLYKKMSGRTANAYDTATMK